MNWASLQSMVVIIQHVISILGILIITTGILFAVTQYIYYFSIGNIAKEDTKINVIRLNLGRILILGLEFIVAADLISTTTAPDYYSIGIVAIVVAIRTLLSFSLNKEIMGLSK